MADIIYRIDGGAWTLAEGEALPFTIPGVGAGNAVEVLGHPEMAVVAADLSGFTPLDLFVGGQEGAYYAAASLTDGPLAAWADETANAADLSQATGTAQPAVSGGAVQFDGGDYMQTATALSQTSGTFAAVFTTGTGWFGAGAQVIAAFSDTGTVDNYIEFGIDALGRLYVTRNNSGAVHTVSTTRLLALDTTYSLTVVFDGEDFVFVIDGEQEPVVAAQEVSVPGWFGSVAGGDTLTVGARVTSDGAANHFRGSLTALIIVEEEVL